MKFVADTGALISLACSRHSRLIFQEHTFVITPLVHKELVAFSQYEDRLGLRAREILHLKLHVLEPKTLLSLGLQPTEQEVFSLAEEHQRVVLTDDVHAARVGREKTHVPVKPGFYALLLLYHKKKISLEKLEEDFTSILHQRNWLSGVLWDYTHILIQKLRRE